MLYSITQRRCPHVELTLAQREEATNRYHAASKSARVYHEIRLPQDAWLILDMATM